jgi:hypothetical protein
VTIQVTDEMLNAFRDAWMQSMQADPRTADPERVADKAGMTAVLAIVKRDYEVRPYCNAVHPSGVVCKRMPHDDDTDVHGGHYAVGRDGQKSVAW